MMVAFVDQNKATWGIEPICATVPIAPSTYYSTMAERKDPRKRSPHRQRDESMQVEIKRVWDDNFQVYGARKV